jgi:Xaa-Pro aminopeptidase
MQERGLDALLISTPENIYYLCGLDHMGALRSLAAPLGADGRSGRGRRLGLEEHRRHQETGRENEGFRGEDGIGHADLPWSDVNRS